MPEESSFPFFIHIVTVPLTLGIGFVLGWILGSRAKKRNSRRSIP